MDHKITELSEQQLKIAHEEGLPYISAFIENEICSTAITAPSREDALRCVAHVIAQLIADSEPGDEDFEYITSMALGYVADQTLFLLEDMLNEDTFN